MPASASARSPGRTARRAMTPAAARRRPRPPATAAAAVASRVRIGRPSETWVTCHPVGTTSPSANSSGPTSPVDGLGTSTIDLSVSISSSGSPSATLSPGCFSHRTTSPSVMATPRAGIRTAFTLPPHPLALVHPAWAASMSPRQLAPGSIATATNDTSDTMCAARWSRGHAVGAGREVYAPEASR